MKKLVLILSVVFISLSALANTPCKGVTKAGKPCASVIVDSKTGYCNAHNPNRVKCTGITTAGKPCNMIVMKESKTCRIHVKK